MDDKTSTYDWVTVEPDYGEDDPAHPAQPSALLTAIKLTLVFAAFFLLWAGLEHRRSIAFATSAVETHGTITAKWISRYHWIGRRAYYYHRNSRHYISVGFTDTDGKEQRFRDAVTLSEWHQLSVGSRVAVWYVPGDPGNFAILNRERIGQEIGLLFAGIVAVAVAGWLYFEFLATRPRVRPHYAAISARIRKRKERRFGKLRRGSAIYRPMT